MSKDTDINFLKIQTCVLKIHIHCDGCKKVEASHRRVEASAVGAVTRTSCENMQAVIVVFFDYGLSCGNVLAMSKKHPQVLQYGSESLDKKIEFLVEGMERDVGELLVFPAFLGYKLDDRIKEKCCVMNGSWRGDVGCFNATMYKRDAAKFSNG